MNGCSEPIFYDEMIVNGEVASSCVEVGIGKTCWFIGAVAALTPYHQILSQLFVSCRNAKQGIYTLKFWKNNEVKLCIFSHFINRRSSKINQIIKPKIKMKTFKKEKV